MQKFNCYIKDKEELDRLFSQFDRDGARARRAGGGAHACRTAPDCACAGSGSLEETELLATEIANMAKGSVWESVLGEVGLLGKNAFRHVLFFDEGKELPTDFRHNSKIDRQSLAKWAEKKLDGSI